MKSRSVTESVRFAVAGVVDAFRAERNLRIHVAAGIVVIASALVVGVSAAELAVLLLAVGFVISAELFNTALERIVDLLSPDYHHAAGVVKNVAAAAVLVSAAVSVAVGLAVFRSYLSVGPAALLGVGYALIPRLVPGGRPGRLAHVTPIDAGKLLKRAREVRERAYVPYSGFKVGAALLTTGGRIFAGCNFENASLGATICAERAAVGMALSEGQRDWAALAVVADGEGPVAPCGICRQVLAEFAPDMPVIMANTRGERRTLTVRELLPSMFHLSAAGDDDGNDG